MSRKLILCVCGCLSISLYIIICLRRVAYTAYLLLIYYGIFYSFIVLKLMDHLENLTHKRIRKQSPGKGIKLSFEFHEHVLYEMN